LAETPPIVVVMLRTTILEIALTKVIHRLRWWINHEAVWRSGFLLTG